MRVSDKLVKTDDPEDAFCEQNQAKEYKGIFYGDDSEKKYFEGGAHFNYKDLYRKLFDLTKKLSPSRVESGRLELTQNVTDRTERSDKNLTSSSINGKNIDLFINLF